LTSLHHLYLVFHRVPKFSKHLGRDGVDGEPCLGGDLVYVAVRLVIHGEGVGLLLVTVILSTDLDAVPLLGQLVQEQHLPGCLKGRAETCISPQNIQSAS